MMLSQVAENQRFQYPITPVLHNSSEISKIEDFLLVILSYDEDGVVPAESERLGKGRFDGVGGHLSYKIEVSHGIFEISAYVGGLVTDAQ